ncbi:MAG: Asp23/Gls24 family envelope stress response protein [Chloroflexi bacterium]|nr:Asp23/Gls24 family envelope stress response protein [Chloroflexota bacterium]
MTGENTPLGKIEISPDAIASIAYQSAIRSYGVVGLASKNLVEGLANVLVRDPRHGVDVKADGEDILIDIYVVIEYGTRIASVAGSVANTVRFNVEKALGLPVKAVNVHVQGLRVSEPN